MEDAEVCHNALALYVSTRELKYQLLEQGYGGSWLGHPDSRCAQAQRRTDLRG